MDVTSPMHGTVVSVDVSDGETVPEGSSLVVIESMKMEHVVVAPFDGTVSEIVVGPGQTVPEGAPLMVMRRSEVQGVGVVKDRDLDLDLVRGDLQEVLARHEERRGEAIAAWHAKGRRTARENIEDLCDPGSFLEYGPLVIAAQRARRELADLVERTPGDGLVGGVGRVGGREVIAMSYDYLVLAGTQGAMNHYKKDRLFELAERRGLPVVLFAEGGGGRPGDTDTTAISGLDCMAFHLFARLSGRVPLVGIVSGKCFAGNAALLGCCDVIIATPDANVGMGGPAMIEGGGLGVFAATDIGPMDVQVPNGVVDILEPDEAAAVATARRYLGYFSGEISEGVCGDQRLLRHLIPEDRKRVYDVRAVIGALCDTDSVLELRPEFGRTIITALVRVEGRAIGLLANDPRILGGAIDADGADKAARFMRLCDGFGVPLLSLCDTPGFMVGPDAEETATVRHFSRMFVAGANLSVPLCSVILRKAYGLGAQAMAGGSLKVPVCTVAWPTGELGGMGLEGAVRLGFRKELAAAEDSEALFETLVARMYERGKAMNAATVYELDDVIDPAETRRWVTMALGSPLRGERRLSTDTW
jgi:acetyl-CoA carboxylase carboxyltransferase component